MFVRGGDFAVLGDSDAGDLESKDLRARLMRHPGPVAADRYAIGGYQRAIAARVHLQPGDTLLAGLGDAVGACSAARAPSAVFTLLHGRFRKIVFCLAAKDATERTVATYTPWKTVDEADVLGGSATFGYAVDGAPMVHCHAWFSACADGRLAAGHLDPARTVVGAGGLVLVAKCLGDVTVRQTPDPETNHAVFMPHGEPA